MKIRKRERILITIFVVSLAGLAIDRLLVSGIGPQSALADDEFSDSAPVPVVIQPQRSADSQPAPPAEVADVFLWNRLGPANPRLPVAPPATETPTADSASFASTHALDAVILGPQPRALVSGVALRIGDRLDGFTLQELRLREARFVSDTAEVTLRLPDAGVRR